MKSSHVSRQKLSRSDRGTLLTDFLTITCSVCFSIQNRATCSRLEALPVGWILECQSLIKKMPLRLARRPILQECLFGESNYPNDSSSCQVPIKLTKTTGKAPDFFKDSWLKYFMWLPIEEVGDWNEKVSFDSIRVDPSAYELTVVINMKVLYKLKSNQILESCSERFFLYWKVWACYHLQDMGCYFKTWFIWTWCLCMTRDKDLVKFCYMDLAWLTSTIWWGCYLFNNMYYFASVSKIRPLKE